MNERMNDGWTMLVRAHRIESNEALIEGAIHSDKRPNNTHEGTDEQQRKDNGSGLERYPFASRHGPVRGEVDVSDDCERFD